MYFDPNKITNISIGIRFKCRETEISCTIRGCGYNVDVTCEYNSITDTFDELMNYFVE
jgi:hypothetical protein